MLFNKVSDGRLFGEAVYGQSSAERKRRRSRILKSCTRPVVEPLEPRRLLAGDGLAGAYYDNSNFTGATLSRVDAQVAFNWGSGAPASSMQANTFSVRWTGQVEVPTSGTYTFYTRTDDGVRLWVNGVRLVNNWTNQGATERSGRITLEAGRRYDIRMDYYENTGSAVAQLRWSGPGIVKQFIPQTRLYSTTPPAPATNLQASPTGSVILTWTDNATNEQGWLIERSSDGANFTQLALLPANSSQYTDETTEELATYLYRLTATSMSGSSAPATVSVTTPLRAPSNLTATAGANTPRVQLNWSDESAKETNYMVARSVDGVTFTPIAELPANATAFTDAGSLAAGASYQYQVTATIPGVSSTAASATATAADFRVFDGTLFSGRPDLSPYGIERIYVAYAQQFFRPDDTARLYPDETLTRAVARNAASQKQVLVIDIENWAMDIRRRTPEEVQQNIAKFTTLIGWIRDEAPELKLGIYSILPSREMRPDLFTAEQMDAWSESNAYLAPLAQQVDYLFPSFYTFYDDPSLWVSSIRAALEQASQYGKPIYPFLWMNLYGGPELPASVWRMELDTLRPLVQGVVLWGGNKLTWDASAPWWVETASFASTNA